MARGLVGAGPARAQHKYKVKIYALVVMSNHLHLVVQTTEKNLSEFMGYFKARTAEAINRLTGKRGPLWARRYDAQPILDDNAGCGRVAYSLDNPVNGSLVESASEWPGLNLSFGMGDSDSPRFEYLDCTAWHRARRPARLGPFYRAATLELSPLPAQSHLSRELYRQSVEGWLRESTGGRGKELRPTAIGLDKVVHTAFDARPKDPERKRRPYAFGSREKLLVNYQEVSQVYALHRECSERFLTEKRDVAFSNARYKLPARSRRGC